MQQNTRPHVSSLCFHLYERSIHPELFTVVRRAEVTEPAYRATLWITGHSHALALRADGETLTEILAPPGAPLPRLGLKSTIDLGRVPRDDVVRLGGGIRYRASVRLESYSAQGYREAQAELLEGRHDGPQRLKGFFPDPETPGDGAFTPFALVDYRVRPRRLEVTSVHACPEEHAILVVDSRFEVAS